jgi:tetratricopeptide (TPR) repeat protein
MPSETKFDSEGFDLGASNNNNDEVIYEIGGGITATAPLKKEVHQISESSIDSPIAESERLKELGNNEFRQQNHLDAYDYYTDAIEACPMGEGMGPTGEELLKLRDEFDEGQREIQAERHRRDMERRRRPVKKDGEVNKEDDYDEDKEQDEDEKGPVEFIPPRHTFGTKLAVYYANRAATSLHLGHHEEAIQDCDIALLYNPTYVKAYLRRCAANERIENTEGALRDAKKAYELDPANSVAKKNVSRLQKIEEERLEKLKEETMGKLKELGNSILGNFGLSLDNFSAVQDPKTGGYSISFNQNK